jgi:hypothetical protein
MKRYFFYIGIFLFFLVISSVVYAYSSFNNQPEQAEAFGHSADEVVVKMNDGSIKTVQELLKEGISQGEEPASFDGVFSIRAESLSGILPTSFAKGDVTLNTDFSIIQKRVSGSCPVGRFINSINSDGTVICTSS